MRYLAMDLLLHLLPADTKGRLSDLSACMYQLACTYLSTRPLLQRRELASFPPTPLTTPCSWGELLRGYRTTYGSQAYASLKPGDKGPEHFPRTTLTALDKNKNLFGVGADHDRARLPTEAERCSRVLLA